MAGMRGLGRAGALRLGVVAAVVPLLAGCWRQAGVDATHTWSNGSETSLTTANVGSLRPVWTADIGSSVGEPILADGRIYVNEITSDDIFVHDGARALDAATGATVWQRTLADSDLDLNVVMRGVTPAVVGDEVWTSFQVGEQTERGTRCAQSLVRLDGATGAAVVDQGLLGSTAVPAGGLIAQNFTGSLDCTPDAGARVSVRDSSSLATIWSATTAFPEFSDLIGPTVAGGQLYSIGQFGISAFAAPGCGAATCSPLWTFLPPDFMGTLGPVEAPGGGEVYAVLYHPFDGSTQADVLALDAATGAVNWQAPVGTSAGDGLRVRLATDGTSVYAASSSPAGRSVEAFPVGGCGAATCSPTWTGSTSQDVGVGVDGSRPVVAGGVVYLADAAGVHAFAAKGCGAATCPEIASVPVPGARYITVDGGRLYVATGNSLTALAPT